MASGDGFTLYQQRMEAKSASSGDTGSIWDNISQLLPILLPLITGCFGGGKALRKPRRLGNRALVAAHVQRATGCSWVDAFKVADHSFDVLDESTLEEFQLFVTDCCS